MKGNVKFFNQMKGFGFIASEDGKEYFVHISDLGDGVTIKDNDAVNFDVVEGDRGPKAANVSLDDGSSEPAQEEQSADEPAQEEQPEEESSDDEAAPEAETTEEESSDDESAPEEAAAEESSDDEEKKD